MSYKRKDDDFWAGLLDAAEAEAARRAGKTPKPPAAEPPAGEDPWADLLGTAETEAARRAEKSAESPAEKDPWADLLGAAAAEAARRTKQAPEAPAGGAAETENAGRPEKPAESAATTVFDKGSMLLDTYRIESEPMHGGMGSVWRVHHSRWNTDLAMKRPQPDMFTTEASRQGFIDECRNWIGLGVHPNIVSCYYVREIDGVPAIFSEWMENGDLEHHITGGTLYEGSKTEVRTRLLDIAIQYARGLRYAHENGLIHQDVKPANLLLTDDWQAKAADFGLANAAARLSAPGARGDRDAGGTLNAAAGGYTPAYCSMEQMDGKVLTRRTDIYSWAVSVMEMYLGSRPWQNGVVAGAACRDYMDAEDCRVKVPAALRELLAKCMEMNPDDRPHDFAEVEKKLILIYRDTAGEDYPRPKPEAAPDTADSLNNRALTYLDLGMPEKAEECWEKALRKKPDHLAAVYNQGLYDWREGRISYPELLEACGNADARRDDTGLAARWKDAVDAEYHNDYGRIVPLGDEETTPFGHPFAVLSPDRKRVYCGVENRVCCWDTDTLKQVYAVREKRDPGRDYIQKFLLTRDGRYLAGLSGDRTLWVADAGTGKTLRYLCRDEAGADSGPGDRKNRIVAVCLHPDSRRVAVLWGFDLLQVYHLETGRLERKFFIGNSAVQGWKWAVCFSPDGGILYIGTTAGSLCALDFETGAYRDIVNMPSGTNIESLQTSGGGKWLWCCTTGDTFIRCRAGKLKRYEILTPPVPLSHPFWISEDGTRMLAIGKNSNPYIWNPASGEIVRSFHCSGTSFSLDAAEDLSLIVLGNGEKALQFWDGRTAPCPAPWELSRARDWKEQNAERQETERLGQEIDSRIRAKQFREAVRLLEEAEGRYDPVLFLPQRRKLSGLCGNGGITDVNAVVRFDPIHKGMHMLEADPPGRDVPAYYCVTGGLLAADPRGGVFTQYYYGDSPTVCLYSETGSLLSEIPLQETHQDIGSLVYAPSGRLLAAGCRYSVVLIDPDRGSVVRTLGDPVRARFMQYAEPVFSPDGGMLIAGGDGAGNRSWGLWNTETGRLIRPLEKPPVQWASSDNAVFRFLDGGKKLISSVRGCGRLYIYDTDTGKIKNEIQTTAAETKILGLTPDNRLLFVDFGPGKPVSVIDTQTWKIAGNLNAPSGDSFHAMCFSPDGSLMAAFSGRALYILSVPEMEQQQAIPYDVPADSVRLAFSGDGCLLGLRIFDTIHVLSLRRRLIAD